jgi:large subunit ribosomal protein L18
MKRGTTKPENRLVRRRRIRAKVAGTPVRPRLSVFKSNKYIYAQLIDDTTGTTIAAASSNAISKGTDSEKAGEVGRAIAKLAKEKKIEKAVFDRGGYIYTGKIKTLAEGAREGGLDF